MLKDNDADCQSPAAAFELPLHRSQGTMVRPKTPNQDETAAKPKLPAAAQVFASTHGTSEPPQKPVFS
jgi:hypothetical protein